MTPGPVHWKGVLAKTGVIDGGVLHGWSYAFLQFVVIDGVPYIDAQCTPPNWPFPTPVRFNLLKQPIHFKVIKGQRAERLNANALIEVAYAKPRS